LTRQGDLKSIKNGPDRPCICQIQLSQNANHQCQLVWTTGGQQLNNSEDTQIGARIKTAGSLRGVFICS